ncbi:MAG: S8 family serine peptidase, partial [Patulibacter sp.]
AQAAQQSRRQRSGNHAAQARVVQAAEDRDLVDRELYRVATAYNGIAVTAEPADVPRLRALPGVRTVVPLPRHERSNAASVPFVGAPAAWQAPGGGYAGQGIRVGVIDTGIDYVHRTFGGSGQPADLASARSTASNPLTTGAPDPSFTVRSASDVQLYPSPRVAGGFDFAGDAYDADVPATSTPRPDPNPMDCPLSLGGGHGTHVAGTVGGAGVTTTGDVAPWQTVWPPSSTPRVGTGVAPAASLYGLRVFGCDGTSNLVPLALDWALDPNRDGSTADRLDVLNLSLGSAFGNQEDPSAVAVQNASAAGIVVVVSAGNDGDQTYQVGSPGVAPRAITVANMVSGSWRDGLQVTGASGGSNANGIQDATFGADLDWNALDAPISAPLHRPATNRTGCAGFSSGEATAMAGKVVLLDWLSGGTSPCGSAARALNVRNAGGAGVVLATEDPAITVSIAGDSVIPSAYVAADVRDKLLAALAEGGATIAFDRANVAYRYDATPSGTVADSSSRGPAGGGGLKPDLAAPGTDIRSAQAGSGTGAVTLTGTSMAAPHVAGAMAILRQRRPTWTVEELKAAVVNTASPDLYAAGGQTGPRHAPTRIGTGTLDVAAAIATEAVAFAADADGAGGVSFGPLQAPVGAPFQTERTIDVVNRGATAVTYAVSFDERGPVPGVGWELPDGATVTVPANDRRTIRLRLKIDDPAQLRNARDAAMATVQEDEARRWLAEATGLVRLSSAGRPTLSVAAHASVRPAAGTRATTTAVVLDPGATSGSFALGGSAFATGSTTDDFAARRTVLEHQATSPRRTVAPGDPALARADVQHVGVGLDADGRLTFGVSFWDRLPARAGFADVEVAIDSNRDGTDDYLVYSTRLTDTDVFVSCVWRVITNSRTGCYRAPTGWTAAEGGTPAESGTFDSDVLTLAVPRAAVGLATSGVRFDYTVRTWAAGREDPVDEVGPQRWAPDAAGVRFMTNAQTADDPGTVAFAFDAAAAAARGTLGILVLHHLAVVGQTAETVAVTKDGPPVVDPPDEDPPVVIPPVIDQAPGVGPEPPGLLTPPVPSIRPVPQTAAKRCRVPRVTGRTLASARKRLRRADCRLGTVTRPKARTVRGKRIRLRPLVVHRQSVKPGLTRKAGTKVALKLRERPRR